MLASFLLAAAGPGSATAVAQSHVRKSTSQPALVSGKEVAHWSGLPFWAKEACACGSELPLPLGLSANVFSETANFHVPKVTLGGNDGGLLDVGGLVRVTNAHIKETAYTSRLDAWILPFFDLYAIAGYVEGQAEIGLRPSFLPIGPKYDLKAQFGGPTVGLGGTLAGGFKPLRDRSTTVFGLMDLNFTRTFLEFNRVVASLDPVDVAVFSMRIGVRECILKSPSLGDVHVSVWGGGMYQGVQDVMTGRLGILHPNFRANVEAVNPWNTLVGGRLEIGENTVVTVETGLGDRKSVMLEATFRF